MSWMFHCGAEFTDGEIDLIPIRLSPPAGELGFGPERNWRITLHGKRREIGRLSFRGGESRATSYFGHIGYHIDPPWRGRHYAARACRLIGDLIVRSGKSSVVITCGADHLPSPQTCESLGRLREWETDVPLWLQEKYDISARKERYIWIPG